MAEVLALDWRCSQCGDAMTWQLVKPAPGQEQTQLADARLVVRSLRRGNDLDAGQARLAPARDQPLPAFAPRLFSHSRIDRPAGVT
jgi:hypothetical protein